MSMAVDSKLGLKVGPPSIKSVGSLAFSPEGILFIADNAAATIVAVDVNDTHKGSPGPVEIANLDTRLAAYLGCAREDVFIRDMAVHPSSHSLYLSVMRGSGAAAVPVLVKVNTSGQFSEVRLENVPFSQVAIKDAPAVDDKRQEGRLVQGSREGEMIEPRPGWKLRIARDPLRTVTVTDMHYVGGMLIVAGASNEEFSSTLRRIPFPFTGNATSNSLEIYHVSHAKYETASPIRTFLPFHDNASVLASYTCTPVVHFSLKDLKPGQQVKGRTVAELGSGNTPLDIVAFNKDGEEFLLVSNARHPLMKLRSKDVEHQEALTQPKEPVGIAREKLPHPGVSKMANLGSHVAMLQLDEAGHYHLHSYATAEL